MRTSMLVLAVLFAASSAYAQVGIVVTGDATVQPLVAAQLEIWLHDHGRQVVPGPLESEAINTLIDCFVLEDLNCARGVVDARSKSKSLVYARAEATQNEDGTREVAITAYWFQKNHDALAERRICKRCTDRKLDATVDEVMLALVHEPPPPLEGASARQPPDPPAAETAPIPWLPLSLIGGGGAVLVAGIVMIAIDQDPTRNGVQEPQYRDTATGGVLLGAVGAAAIGAGVYLWITGKPSSGPVAGATHDGGYIGWAGRF